MQFRVSDVLHVLFWFALPDDGRLIAARFQMPVKTVHREVELAVREKRVLDFPRVRVPVKLARDGRRLDPFERARLLQPECVRLTEGTLIHRFELRRIQQRMLDDFRRRRKCAAFLR